MPRRRSSSARRSFDALLSSEPKTPNGTPAYGTPAHSAWLAQAYGWGPQKDLERFRANRDAYVVTHDPETGKVKQVEREPCATLAAEPPSVERRRRRDAKRLAEVQRLQKERRRDANRLVFDPSQVVVCGWKDTSSGNIPGIKYLGPGSFDYEVWCAYAGVTPKTGEFKFIYVGMTADEILGRTRVPADTTGPDFGTPEAQQAARERYEERTGRRFGIWYYNPEYPQSAPRGALPIPPARGIVERQASNLDTTTTDGDAPTSPHSTRRVTRSMSRRPSSSPRSAGPSPHNTALGSDDSLPSTPPGVTSRQASSAGMTRRSSAAAANRRSSSGTRRSPRSRRNSQVLFALLG